MGFYVAFDFVHTVIVCFDCLGRWLMLERLQGLLIVPRLLMSGG